MYQKLQRILVVATIAGGLVTTGLVVQAHDDGGSYGSGGSYGGSGSYGERPSKAVSYINRDAGAATENTNISSNSSCFSPDRFDESQKLSSLASGNPGDRNVHNDACFFGSSYSGSYGGSSSSQKINGPATFVSLGVGYISACPDPDDRTLTGGTNGPEIAFAQDRNNDGRIDFCFQSSYQKKGIAGDKEFHARLNNNSTPGEQNVTWCYDPDRNGCSDERVKNAIRVNWVR